MFKKLRKLTSAARQRPALFKPCSSQPSFDLLGTVGAPLGPLLGPLAHNGGPTMTYALLKGSLAIDHGDNSGVPATDQRGQPRIKNRVVDIGAFEL
jgi:hypothetical protein